MINKIQFLSFVHLSKIETIAKFILALKHFVSMALFGISLISYYIYLRLIFDILQFEILSLMSWIFFLVWTRFLQATQSVKIWSNLKFQKSSTEKIGGQLALRNSSKTQLISVRKSEILLIDHQLISFSFCSDEWSWFHLWNGTFATTARSLPGVPGGVHQRPLHVLRLRGCLSGGSLPGAPCTPSPPWRPPPAAIKVEFVKKWAENNAK